LAKVKSMHRVDTFGNSPRVCQKLAEGTGSLLGWRNSDDVVGSRRKFARSFVEGIGKKTRGLATRLPEVDGVCGNVAVMLLCMAREGSGGVTDSCWGMPQQRLGSKEAGAGDDNRVIEPQKELYRF
ncbi:hypothetical protein B296_00038804, partial [Ensete ventricosum]